MRELIMKWLVNLTVFSLLANLLTKVLPGKTYLPFLRLFTGLILILLFLEPVLSGSGILDSLEQNLDREFRDYGEEGMEEKIRETEEKQKRIYEEIYRKEIEKQNMDMGEGT